MAEFYTESTKFWGQFKKQNFVAYFWALAAIGDGSFAEISSSEEVVFGF